MKELTFRKRDRLLKPKEFKRLFDDPQRWSTSSFVVFALPNEQRRGRLGLTVRKEYGSAVKRSEFKRSVRESFRSKPDLMKGRDWNFVARVKRGRPDPDKERLQRDLRWLFRKLEKAGEN